MEDVNQPDIIEGELCPICSKNTLTLTESSREIPYFGLLHLFNMSCSSCGYFKADVETQEDDNPKKYTLLLESEEDLKIRVIKSGSATIKIPHVGSIESTDASNGYVSNVEGIINRIKRQVEGLKDSAEDATARKKAKNILKKIQKILWGQESVKFIIEDPSGQSAIVSDKVTVEKLKTRKK